MIVCGGSVREPIVYGLSTQAREVQEMERSYPEALSITRQVIPKGLNRGKFLHLAELLATLLLRHSIHSDSTLL